GIINIPRMLLQLTHANTKHARYISFSGVEAIEKADIEAFLADKNNHARVLKYRFENEKLSNATTHLPNTWNGITYMLAVSQLHMAHSYDVPRDVRYIAPLEICAAAQIFGLERLKNHIPEDWFMHLL